MANAPLLGDESSDMASGFFIDEGQSEPQQPESSLTPGFLESDQVPEQQQVNTLTELPDGLRIIKFSPRTRKFVDDGKAEEDFSNTPGGGPISRGISTVIQKAANQKDPVKTMPGKDDWYDPKTGEANLNGLMSSGLPPENKYEIFKDIANDVMGIPPDQFEKVLPKVWYANKDKDPLGNKLTHAFRIFQQSTVIPEDLIRAAARNVTSLPPPKEWNTPENLAAVKAAMESGAGEAIVGGKPIKVSPKKGASEADVQKELASSWHEYVKEVTEAFGESLNTFSEGLIAEVIQGAEIAGGLTAAVPTGGAALAPTAGVVAGAIKKGATAYRWAMNPAEKLMRLGAGRIGPRAAAIVAANPTVISALGNATEGFLINNQDLQGRLQMSAVGGALPFAVHGVTKGIPVAHSLVSKKARETRRINNSIDAAIRMRNTVAPEEIQKVISGETELPVNMGVDNALIQATLKHMETTARNPDRSVDAIAHAEITHMLNTAGEDHPVISSLDSAYTTLTGENIRHAAAHDAFLKGVEQVDEPAIKKQMIADPEIQGRMLIDPASLPAFIEAKYGPVGEGVAHVYNDVLPQTTITRRQAVYQEIMRLGTSNTDLTKSTFSGLGADSANFRDRMKYLEVTENIQPRINKLTAEVDALNAQAAGHRETIRGSLGGLTLVKGVMTPALQAKVDALYKDATVRDAQDQRLFGTNLNLTMAAISAREQQLIKSGKDKAARRLGRISRDLRNSVDKFNESIAGIDARTKAVSDIYANDLKLSTLSEFSAKKLKATGGAEVLARRITEPVSKVEDVEQLLKNELHPLLTHEVITKNPELSAEVGGIVDAVAADIHEFNHTGMSNFEGLKVLNAKVAEFKESHPDSPVIYRQLQRVAKAAKVIQRDAEIVADMRELMGDVTESVIPKLPSLRAMVDDIRTTAAIYHAASHMEPAFDAFHREITDANTKYGGNSPFSSFNSRQAFDILSGNLSARIKMMASPIGEEVFNTAGAIHNAFRASQILSAKTVAEVSKSFEAAVGSPFNKEMYFAYFANPDNEYGANGLFQSLFMDAGKFKDAAAQWREMKNFWSGKMGTTATYAMNTETMVQLINEKAPGVLTIELEQFPSALKEGRREYGAIFNRELKTLEGQMRSFWREGEFSDGANALMGLDGLKEIGFFYANHLDLETKTGATVLDPAGQVHHIAMASDPTIAAKTRKLINAFKDYQTAKTPWQKSIELSKELQEWKDLVLAGVSAKFPKADIDKVKEILGTNKRITGAMPKFLHYFTKHGDFGNEKYTPQYWAEIWKYIDFDSKTRREVHIQKKRIFDEEAEKYGHLGVRMQLHKWFNRYVPERRLSNMLTDDNAADRMFISQDRSNLFRTSEEGQLAKTNGISLIPIQYVDAKGRKNRLDQLMHPASSLLDDIHVGIVGARASHAKELLRQSGVLLGQRGFHGLQNWMELLVQKDLQLPAAGDFIDNVRRSWLTVGQSRQSSEAAQAIRIGAPLLGEIALGATRPILSLNRPWSILVSQPLQQFTTAFTATGARSFRTGRTHWLGAPGMAADFMINTPLRSVGLFKSYKSLNPSYAKVAKEVGEGFRDAGDRNRMSRLRHLTSGQRKMGIPSNVFMSGRKGVDATVDFISENVKERWEASMSSIAIETGANAHFQMSKQYADMRNSGASAMEARNKIYRDWRDLARNKSDAEMWQHVTGLCEDMEKHGEAILAGGKAPDSLRSFLTFFQTSTVGRFGTLSNPIAVNTLRILFPRDMRFFSAKNNPAYTVGSAMLDSLAQYRKQSTEVLSPGQDELGKLQAVWHSRVNKMPGQQSKKAAYILSMATMIGMSKAIKEGMDLPWWDTEDKLSDPATDEAVKEAIRRVKYTIRQPEVADALNPIPWLSDEAPRGGAAGEGPFGSAITPEIMEMSRNFVDFGALFTKVGANFDGGSWLSDKMAFGEGEFYQGLTRYLPSQSVYGKAYYAWLDAQKGDDESLKTQTTSQLQAAFDREVVMSGGKAAFYALKMISMDKLYAAAPWDIVSALHLMDTAEVIARYPGTREALREKNYYGPYRDLANMLGIADSAKTYDERLGPVSDAIYDGLSEHMGADVAESYKANARGILRAIDKWDMEHNIIDDWDMHNTMGREMGWIKDRTFDDKRKKYQEEQLLRIRSGEFVPPAYLPADQRPSNQESINRFTEEMLRKAGGKK